MTDPNSIESRLARLAEGHAAPEDVEFVGRVRRRGRRRLAVRASVIVLGLMVTGGVWWLSTSTGAPERSRPDLAVNPGHPAASLVVLRRADPDAIDLQGSRRHEMTRWPAESLTSEISGG